MASTLRPLASLAPLSGQPLGQALDPAADIRRRQALADALAADATNPTGAGGTALGAIGQGLKGLAAANAAASLQPGPTIRIPAPGEGLGSLFGGFRNLLSGSLFGADQDRPPPGTEESGSRSLSSVPTFGVEREDDE